MNEAQKEKSKQLLGEDTVNMLLQVHEDALWILENSGVACKQPEILKVFEQFEEEGLAILFQDRIYVTADLVKRCLETVPGVADFFVPENSFFIGGTASHVYDDMAAKGGISPSAGHVIRIAKAAEKSHLVAGMGRGVQLKDDAMQMGLIAEYCNKPLYFAVTSDDTFEKAKQLHEQRKNIMVGFSLTRPPLEVDENFSDHFVKAVQVGLPVFVLSMPLAGVSAPYCYNGLLAMTHAEALFGICAAQLLNPGVTCVHAGVPTIADPQLDYEPNFGLTSHTLANILMAHLNLMLDLPTFQSSGITHEANVTEKALADARAGQALCMKYGVHVIWHSFGSLRNLENFSFDKLEKVLEMAEQAIPEDAPGLEMPVYDERGMESIKRIGLGDYKEDSLTKDNLGKVFSD